MTARATWMVIDGNSLTYRAFFALPTDMATGSGQVTNAVYGFTSMLVNLVREHRPAHVVVAFDRPEPTFRHDRVPHYKGNRDEAPDILRQQLGLVRQVVEVLGLPTVEISGFEADDVLATLAERAAAAGDDVLIVTGDRDSYQLVRDPHIRVLYNRRGVSDYVVYDEAGIAERTGVRPDRYVQYAALRGDPSDNLPGVPGVGEKTAAKLIVAYDGIDGIYEHLDDQTPKLRANLAEHESVVRTNVEMMALVRDVEAVPALDELQPRAIDADALRQLVEFLEFGSLAPRIAEAFELDAAAAGVQDGEVLEPELLVPDGQAAVVAALEELVTGGVQVAIDGVVEHRRFGIDLDAVVLATTPAAPVLIIDVAMLQLDAVRSSLARCLGVDGPGVLAHGAKPLVRALLDLDIEVRGLRADTRLAAYLLDPSEGRYELEELLERSTSWRAATGTDAPAGQLDLDGTAGDPSLDAARRALAAAALAPVLLEALEAQGMAELHRDVEVPLVLVLARMERVGVAVDVAELEALGASLVAECDRHRDAIWELAGGQFNVNSTPQLREVLFDRLGLTPQKKTKTGYSTDAATLEKLRGQHPIVDELLAYREVEKLRSTYAEGLLAEVAPDGRIHATFHQTVARTGRLSSDAPNLHNIPVRTEQGRRFRRAFVAGAGFELLVADYDQIELRCIAHLAEDPGLIAAFESGVDIHTETAARVFGVAPGDVGPELRARAKMVSYGLAYGMEAYGLAQRLGIPTGEASEILDAYFAAFPAVRSYMERAVAEARERGYTETLFGRRRRIPELSSSNHRLRQAGERQAMNAGIQGLAADIFKVALVRLDAELEAAAGRSRLILQVHDEVIVEVGAGEWDEVEARVRAAMAEAFDLRVPLAVHLARGENWAEAKG